MNKACGFLAVAALLAGCAGLPNPLTDTGKRPPKYQPSSVTRFGDWFSEQGSCELTGNSADVKPVTDGGLSGGNLTLRITFSAPLATHPRASFNTYPVPLNLEGSGQTYTLVIPYTPTAVAHYIQADQYLTLSFETAHSGDTQEINFATAGLVSGVTYLSRTCR